MSINYIRDIDASSHRDVADIEAYTGACRDIPSMWGLGLRAWGLRIKGLNRIFGLWVGVLGR